MRPSAGSLPRLGNAIGEARGSARAKTGAEGPAGADEAPSAVEVVAELRRRANAVLAPEPEELEPEPMEEEIPTKVPTARGVADLRSRIMMRGF